MVDPVAFFKRLERPRKGSASVESGHDQNSERIRRTVRESTAVDLQQTSVSTGARSAASDKVALILYGKGCGEQGQQGTAEQGRELKGEHLKNCEGMTGLPI